ncbi:D-alanyl-D-alanine carboxypeptidase [Alloactinosynnema sp. L-07]|uniref:serine hydrolase domain-containing protein n=1 Tax=Alloactinosynnema sp. L-07 TaxID=1653480 RepID=UPI00065EF861|nr:serine hydrolase domain-containing protein [Alloactinosynnema sp. L-07]CRK62200.1 D-alanyl-D-alanine carboxypeptidase [Alloactinosynnema sp. L-07]
MRKWMIAVIVLAIAILTAGSVQAQPRTDNAIQVALDKMTKTGAQGVQVRITTDGRTHAARSGTAELDKPRPVPRSGQFRIGSITKAFTATVVLQLVAEGRLDLDAPVSTYLPGLLPDGDRITVRMLLQHTSGLYNYTAALPLDPDGFESIRYDHHDPRDLVAIATSRPLDFQPGTGHAYSNTNYIVAGLLIEKATGGSYERAVDRRIIRPLRLHSTTAPGDTVAIPGPHAHGYHRANGTPTDITELNPTVAWAAGAMISTTADLDRFIAALLGGNLLPPAQLAEMLRTSPLSNGFGLGLFQMPLPCGGTVWGHTGGIPGYASLMLSTRDTRTRLEMSLTTAPDPGPVEGYVDVIGEVFC